MQGMAFGNGYFLASEMNGNIVKSTDGITWKMVGHAGTGKHTELAFGNAKFAAWGNDNSAVETSTDGSTWKPSTLKSAVFCGGADFQPESACFGSGQPGAWDTNLWVKSVFPGQILKSIDGKKWSLGFRYDANGFDALGIGIAPK
jgi:hypothetical protein